MKCYIDADGVLVNLAAALAQKINEDLDNGLGYYEGSREKKLKKLLSLEREEITEKTLTENLAKHDAKQKKTQWEKALQSYKFSVLSKESANWWADVAPMEDYEKLVLACQEKYGQENVYILTAPVDSDNDNCKLGKQEWFATNTNIKENNVIVNKNKEEYADENALLIDDRTKYCNAFTNGGGTAILHNSVEETIAKLP